MLGSVDEKFPYQKEVFSFLQELSVEKPDVLDKILKIANRMVQNLIVNEQGQGNQESQNINQSSKDSSSGGEKGKSQEEFLEFILNILQKFESQQLEKDLIPIIQKYTPSNVQIYHQIILENFLSNEDNFEKYFNICIEFLKKGLDQDDGQILQAYIKKTETFYLKIKNTNRRGEFIKLLISNILILRQTKNQELIKSIRALWKPTIFSDKEGQEKILEHLEDIVPFLCSKFTAGDEEKILMAADSLIEIFDKVAKEQSHLEKFGESKQMTFLSQLQMGCFLSKLSNFDKVFALLSKFIDRFNLKSIGFQLQGLFRGEWKNLVMLDLNAVNDFYEKQQVDLKVELGKLSKFTASAYFLFLLNKSVISDDILQKLKSISNHPIGIYRMNHNTLHGFLSSYSSLPQAKIILESNVYHYFKLERLSQLKELEKYYGQDYIRNQISSYKGVDAGIVNLQLYLTQTADQGENKSNNQTQRDIQSNNKPLREYNYISFEQKRIMFTDLEIPLPELSQQPISFEESSQMEVEEPIKQQQNVQVNKQASILQGQVNPLNKNQQQQRQNQQRPPPPQQPNQQTQNQAQQKNQNVKPPQKTIPPTLNPAKQEQVQQATQQEDDNSKAKGLIQAQAVQGTEKMQIENEKPKQINNEQEQKKPPTLQGNQLQKQPENVKPNAPPKLPSSQSLDKKQQQQQEVKAQSGETNQPQNSQEQAQPSQKVEKMDIEQEKKEDQQKNDDNKPPSTSNLKDQITTQPNTPLPVQKAQIPNLQIKKPEGNQQNQNNTPSLALGQNQQGNKPTIGQQKQQQNPNQSQTNQASTEQTEKQNNEVVQSTANQPTTPTSNKPVAQLTMKEKALLRMKNKQEDQNQGTAPKIPALQLKEQTQANTQITSSDNTPQSTKNVPSLGLKPLQQQVKSSESLDKPLQENKASLDMLKKPSLLMAKKKSEGQTPSTPSNQLQSTDKMEIEASQTEQSSSSQQNLEKAQAKPALGLKPKMQIKSQENLQVPERLIEKSEQPSIKSAHELKKIQEVEEGELNEEVGEISKIEENKNDSKVQEAQENQNKTSTNEKEDPKQEEEALQSNDTENKEKISEDLQNKEVIEAQIEQVTEAKEPVNEIVEKNEETSEIQDKIEVEEEQQQNQISQQEDDAVINQEEVKNSEQQADIDQEVEQGDEKKIEEEQQEPLDIENQGQVDNNTQNTEQVDNVQMNEEIDQSKLVEETAEEQNQIEEEDQQVDLAQDNIQDLQEENQQQIEEGQQQEGEEVEAQEAPQEIQEGNQEEQQQENEEGDIQQEDQENDQILVDAQVDQQEDIQVDQTNEEQNEGEQKEEGEEAGEINEGEQN